MFSFFIIIIFLFFYLIAATQHNTTHHTLAHTGIIGFEGKVGFTVTTICRLFCIYICVCEVHGEVMLAQQVHTHTHTQSSVYTLYIYVTHTLARHARIRYTHTYKPIHSLTHTHKYTHARRGTCNYWPHRTNNDEGWMPWRTNPVSNAWVIHPINNIKLFFLSFFLFFF